MIDFICLVLFCVMTCFLMFFAIMNMIIAFSFNRWTQNTGSPNPELVTVLVPVRNDESVFNSIESLEHMDYPNYKILIINDSDNKDYNKRLDSLNSRKTRIIHRTERIGKKAGAINFILPQVSNKFTVVFDADHRPTKDFLNKAVSTIEKTKADCVCGYQKHTIGSNSLFDKYYRGCQASGIVNFKTRYSLGLFSIFGGGCGIFRTDWLKKHLFDSSSITEDWELSLRTYLQNDLKLVIRDDLYANAAVPLNLKQFVNQQIRWAEGTIADFKQHFGSVVTSKLGLQVKASMFYQGLYFMLGLIILPSWFMLFIGKVPIPLWFNILLFLFYGASFSFVYIRGTMLEKYTKWDTIKCLVLGFVLSNLMTPVYAYASLRGLISRRPNWIVTKRKGDHMPKLQQKAEGV